MTRLTVILAVALAGLFSGPTPSAASCVNPCPPSGPCTVTSLQVDNECILDWRGNSLVTVTGTIRPDLALSTGNYSILCDDLTVNNGALRAHGSTGSSGGNIDITCAGTFTMTGSGSTIEVSGTDGGGSIDVSATTITINAGLLEAEGQAGTASGGSVMLASSGADVLLVNANIVARGAGSLGSDGGSIELTGASLDLRKALNTSSVTGGGGSIDLTATTGGITMTSTSSINANAGSFDTTGGSGGILTIDAQGDVVLGGEIQGTGSSPDGDGSTLDLDTDGAIRTDAAITLDGPGTGSSGGAVTMTAGTTITINKNILATGGTFASGGNVWLTAPTGITVAATATIRTNAGDFSAGDVSLNTHGALLVAGTVETRSSSTGSGGNNDFSACALTVSGLVDTSATGTGTAGRNTFVANSMTVSATGDVLASPCTATGCNRVTLRAGAIQNAGTILPAPVLVIDAALRACCGNGVTESAAGETCDDANGAFCDTCTPSCALQPTCPSDGNTCTSNCNPATGCGFDPLPNGTACPDDGSVCTVDACTAGVCSHTPNTCDDGLACTIDSCHPLNGCTSTPDAARCDDQNSCTTDSCVPPSGCQHAALPDATACADGDACTLVELCQAGLCTPAGPSRNCDDGNACTIDSCHTAYGCMHQEDAANPACDCLQASGTPEPAGTTCVDGNGCSPTSACNGAGLCVGPVDCNDSDPCTTDACYLGLICVHPDTACPTSCVGQENGAPCSDGDTCSAGSCTNGACTGSPISCGDTDLCAGPDLCTSPVGCTLSYPPIDPACQNLDAFACYKAATAPGAVFAKVTGQSVETADESTTQTIDKPDGLCAPADVAHTAASAPTHAGWLERYKVKVTAAATFVRRVTVRVDNLLDSALHVDVIGRDRLLVPATSPPNPTGLATVEPFACYRVVSSGFTPHLAVPVSDGLATTTLDLKKLKRLCVPANVNGADPLAPTHPKGLLCYQAKRASGAPTFAKQVLFVTTRFGAETLLLSTPNEVCLPSTLTP